MSKITIEDWKKLSKKTITALPHIWWRVAVINILAILSITIGLIIIAVPSFFILGGTEGIQNILLNIRMGGHLDIQTTTTTIILALIATAILITGSITGKTGALLIIQQYTKQKFQNPFKTYFTKTWHYFWRYLYTSILIFWYVIWPIALTIIITATIAGLTIIGLGLTEEFTQAAASNQLNESFFKTLPTNTQMIFNTIKITGILTAIFFGIKRGIDVALTHPKLIQADKTASQTFASATKLVKANWTRIALALITYSIIASIPNTILATITQSETATETAKATTAILDFLYSFFILAPLMISFLYFLTLHLLNKKS